MQSKSCGDLIILIQRDTLLCQHVSSCVGQDPWLLLLSTSYLMADLIAAQRLCSVGQLWRPNGSAYAYWYCADLKGTEQAADYLTGNTRCVVLNFAWSHWPRGSSIIHGRDWKAAKWIHADMHACMDIWRTGAKGHLKDLIAQKVKETMRLNSLLET